MATAQANDTQSTEDMIIDTAIEAVETFDDYAQLAQRTAVFPDGQALGYLGLGAVDEIGELIEKIYDLQNQPEIDHDRSGLIGEAGDVYWYLANLSARLGLTEKLVLSKDTGGYNHNHRPSFTDAVWAYERAQTSLMPNAAELAGLLKKTIRGDKTDKRRYIQGVIASMLSDLDMILSALQLTSPTEVAKANLRKLFDRKERGQLKGDGDNR